MEKHTSPFHRGEKEIQSRLGKQDEMERLGRKVIRDHLPQDHRDFFPSLPFLILGTVDAAGDPGRRCWPDSRVSFAPPIRARST